MKAFRRPLALAALAVSLGLLAGCSDTGSPDSARVAPESADFQAQDAGDSQVESQLVTTGEASISSREPETAAGEFTEAARQMDSRIVSSEQSSRDGRISAEVSVRVPAGRYEELTGRLEDFGEVTYLTTTATDVGQEVVDLEARIAALETSIERLTGLMDEATSVTDLLEAENMLTQRQAELDSLNGQRDYLGDQVAMSTLNVSFREPGDGEGNLFGRAWQALLDSAQALVVFLGAALPWALLIALIAWPVVFLVRRRRRGR